MRVNSPMSTNVLNIKKCPTSWRMLSLQLEIKARLVRNGYFLLISLYSDYNRIEMWTICRNQNLHCPININLKIKQINLQRNLVWVSCEGESPADVENLGPVQYLPRRGFPAYYFPFKNVKGYQPPIVAVQFEKPKSKCHQNHTNSKELYSFILFCIISYNTYNLYARKKH